MGIGFSIFLFVIGAILTFAVDVGRTSGFDLSFSPWSRRRTVAGDSVVEERRIERDLP